MIAFLAALALAAPADRPVTLAMGFGPGFGAPSVGAAASIHGIVHVGSFGVEGVIREGMWSAPTRSIGELSLSGRWRATRWLAVSVGFVHHHETPWDVLVEAPLASIFGTAPGITHRSGAQAALSLDVPLGWGEGDRWGLLVEAGVSGFPEGGHVHEGMDRGPAVYGWIEAGFTFDVGRRRGEAKGGLTGWPVPGGQHVGDLPLDASGTGGGTGAGAARCASWEDLVGVHAHEILADRFWPVPG